MRQSDTKAQIISELRNASDPATSAKQLADSLDVSVRTINNHTEDLVEEGRINSTQIGNAKAYYVSRSDLPTHKKSDYKCGRCGRDVESHHDFAKIDTARYFSGDTWEPGTPDFFIFCRFCYLDFIKWVHQDVNSIGDYPHVHSWDISTEQLEEVRSDSETKTAPDLKYLTDDDQITLYEFISENQDSEEYSHGVPKDDILDYGEETGMYRERAEQALQKLKRAGHLFQTKHWYYRTAK